MIHFGFGCYVIRVMDMNLVVGLDVTIVAACLFALISCYLERDSILIFIVSRNLRRLGVNAFLFLSIVTCLALLSAPDIPVSWQINEPCFTLGSRKLFLFARLNT